MKIIHYALIFLFTIAFTAQADQNTENAKNMANEIYYQVLSPFCPGRALADCPSTKAEELKDEILRELLAGKNKAQVLDIVFKKYGEEFNSKPDFSGFASLAWLIPVLFFITLGLIFYIKIRKDSKSAK